MIAVVKSRDQIPGTHNCQLNEHKRCPITGKSEPTVRKVVHHLPGIVAYLVEGHKRNRFFYNPADVERSAEANRAYDKARGVKRHRVNGTAAERTAWENVLAARKLYLDERDKYIHLLQSF